MIQVSMYGYGTAGGAGIGVYLVSGLIGLAALAVALIVTFGLVVPAIQAMTKEKENDNG